MITTTAGWVRSASGGPPTHVGIALPDAAGRLRVSRNDTAGGRIRSERRRTAFRAQIPMRLDVGRRDASAFIPLVFQGASLGVLEISGPRQGIEEAWETLGVIGDQAAITLHHLSEQGRLRRQIDALEGVAILARDLVKAREPQDAVELAARFIGERLSLPVAAWIGTANSGRLTLVSADGPGAPEPKELRGEIGVVSRSVLSGSVERSELVRRFAHSLAARDIVTIEAGEALLLVAHSPESLRPTLQAIGALLAGFLPQIASMARAEQRSRGLDMGLAWTAHELRAPLVDVRAVVEHVLRTDAPSPFDLAMLRRSLVELEDLVRMTEGLMGWAVGQRSLHRRTADVVKIVSDAVRSCQLGWGDRINVTAPSRVMAKVDPLPVRRAIENVLRNALEYSDPGSRVEVLVKEDAGIVAVGVRDEGPQIPKADSEKIFDPFLRGTASGSSRNVGLGLFIARRVMEAHGGRIWVDSDRKGTRFTLQMPIGLAKAQRSAS
jgi:signal transduction histidine kinase